MTVVSTNSKTIPPAWCYNHGTDDNFHSYAPTGTYTSRSYVSCLYFLWLTAKRDVFARWCVVVGDQKRIKRFVYRNTQWWVYQWPASACWNCTACKLIHYQKPGFVNLPDMKPRFLASSIDETIDIWYLHIYLDHFVFKCRQKMRSIRDSVVSIWNWLLGAIADQFKNLLKVLMKREIFFSL